MVRVEFYGVPRIRAGIGTLDVGTVATLGEAFNQLAARLPMLQGECFEPGTSGGWELNSHCVANLSGDRFVRDPKQPLGPRDVLLILSADAGG